MNPPSQPPSFPKPPSRVPPPRRGMGAGKIILLILIAVGIMVPIIGSLGPLAVSQFQQALKGAWQKKSQPLPSLRPPPPLSPEQQKALLQFGQELADALTAKDSAAVTAMLDSEGMATRVFEKLSDLPDAAAVRKGFIKGVSKREGSWLSTLMEGEVVALRTRERQDFPAVLLRMKTDEGAVNYVDVMVRPDRGGFKAVDMFNYIFATTATEEARTILAVLTAKSGVSSLSDLLGIPQVKMDEKVAARLEAITKAQQTGDAQEILRICDSLPAELKTQRTFFIIRLQALMALSSTGSEKIDEDYKQALRAAPDILGKDSTTDLLMVDLLFMEKDFQGADDCLKRMETVVGGDPYLKYLRGNARLQMKDYEGALSLANEAEKEDPEMTEAIDLRIGIHLERKAYKAVVAELRALKKNFDIALDRSALTEDVYKDFLASPEFAAWEKEIAAAP